jgi:hypothetical protein
MKFTGDGDLFYQVSGIVRIGEEMNDSVVWRFCRYSYFAFLLIPVVVIQ